MTWNTAACEVGEFGVNQVNLEGRELEPFHPVNLHKSGLVFEPTSSALDALEQARREFEAGINRKANLDRVGQSFVRIIRPRQGLVYYPLWVIRYDYRGRTFQVVVDGYSGETLYGKAPGNLYFRAGVLVGGMALGSFLAIDVAYMILDSSSKDDSVGAAIGAFVGGLAVMLFAYRRYRYGEHYEYRRRYAKLGDSSWSAALPDSVRQLTNIAQFLERSR